MAPPILVVDDDVALSQTMALAIENAGVPVEQCTTGETAIDLIRAKRYAVIVLDLILEEGVSGLYVVNAIRELPPEQRPLILMTTAASLENLRGVDRGLVAAVMLKPLDFELFAEYVLATYRRAIRTVNEVAAAVVGEPGVRTYCGSCGTAITPWVFDPPHPAEAADTFQLWVDTPCTRCGTAPRQAGGRSEWTPSADGRTLVA